jgi:hypothetical protein
MCRGCPAIEQPLVDPPHTIRRPRPGEHRRAGGVFFAQRDAGMVLYGKLASLRRPPRDMVGAGCSPIPAARLCVVVDNSEVLARGTKAFGKPVKNTVLKVAGIGRGVNQLDMLPVNKLNIKVARVATVIHLVSLVHGRKNGRDGVNFRRGADELGDFGPDGDQIEHGRDGALVDLSEDVQIFLLRVPSVRIDVFQIVIFQNRDDFVADSLDHADYRATVDLRVRVKCVEFWHEIVLRVVSQASVFKQPYALR